MKKRRIKTNPPLAFFRRPRPAAQVLTTVYYAEEIDEVGENAGGEAIG